MANDNDSVTDTSRLLSAVTARRRRSWESPAARALASPGRLRCVTCCLVVAAIAPQRPSHASNPPSLANLVRRHKSTRDAIHDLEMRLVMYPEDTSARERSKADPSLRNYRHYQWYRKGAKERLVVRPLTGADLAQAAFAGDVRIPNVRTPPSWYNEYSLDWRKGAMCQLEIPEREKLSRLSRQSQFGLQATISPIQRCTPKWTPHHVLLLRFMLNAFDASRTLEDLIAECHGKYAGEAVVDGHACHRLSFTHPGSGGIDKDVRFTVFLDPAIGCLARRLVIHRPKAEGGEWCCTITEFRDLGNGLYFPTAARWWSGGELHAYVLRALELKANHGKVKLSDVTVAFPKGARVLVLASSPSPLRAPAVKEIQWIGADGAIEERQRPGDLQGKQKGVKPSESTPTDGAPRSSLGILFVQILVGIAGIVATILALRALRGRVARKTT